MKLTERLMTIAEMVKKCDVIADIGTDHGYIPIYCITNNMAKSAIACDINQGPLDIAKENISKYGLDDRITLRLSDGVSKLKKAEADVIVIAGMGGLLINHILEEGKDIIDSSVRLILQPMLAQKEVRKYLYENGYDIISERLAKEGQKLYNIIEAKKSGSEVTYSEFDIVVGKRLYEEKDELFDLYTEMRMNTLRKIIKGISGSKDKEGLDEYIKELEFFESIYNNS
ncbi:MAG: SAM-dependent methyltransferase [Ruminococcaceae bacterium]|nr:SAM-dependent methyltransferase [Oscillospiraceae bacterium]